MEGIKKTFFGVLFSTAFLLSGPPIASTQVAAESPVESATGLQQTETSPEAAEASAPSDGVETPTPAPSPTPEPFIEPLDAWQGQPLATPAPVAEEKAEQELKTDSIVESEAEETVEDLLSWRDKLLPDEKEAGLNKKQKKRWEKLRQAQIQRALRKQKELLQKLKRDPRGEREIRICTLNLQNFGLKNEVKRFLKTIKGYTAKRIALTKLIMEAECDAIAVQGVVGRSTGYARQGLDELRAQLDKKFKAKKEREVWRSVVTQPEKELGFNGFLYRADRVEYISSKTHRALELSPLAGSDQKLFGRTPLEVQFRVKRRAGEGSKRFLLFSAQFQRALTLSIPESEQFRVQMAEVLRETAVQRLREEVKRDPFDAPVLILGVDTGSTAVSPAAMVLDGRYRQHDLSHGCSLAELSSGEEPAEKPVSKKKEKVAPKLYIKCTEPPENEKIFFNLLREQLPEKQRYQFQERSKRWRKVKFRRKVRAERRALREISSGLWMLPTDLPLAAQTAGYPGRSWVGSLPLLGGEPKSPLVWVDLNW